MKPGVVTLCRIPNVRQVVQALAGKTLGSVLPIAVVLALLCLLTPADSHAQNIISTVAGGGALNSSPLSLDLPGPTSAVRDAAGNTYIAAPNSNYVFKLSGGSVEAYAGTGIEGYNQDGIAATSAELALANGLTLDSQGNLYIAEYGDSRIRMVDTSGTITTLAGSGKQCEPATGLCGDGGPAKKANFNFPMAVALDSTGNLYIADAFDNRIRAVNMQSQPFPVTLFGVSIPKGGVATIAGNGVPCNNPTASTSPCGDGGSPLGPTLNYPQSLAFDSAGNLYIADTRDNRIRMIPPSGATITTVAGDGAICVPTNTCGDGLKATSAHLHNPMWIFIDPLNNLYIADTNNHKIRLVDATTQQKISTIAGTGVAGFNGDGNALSAQLNAPASVFVDSSGNVIIADSGNQRVRQINGGNITTIAGGGSGNDSQPATQGILANPFDVAEDSAGNLYIADTANNRIRFVDMQDSTQGSPPTISTLAGTGIAGYGGDGGLATNALLNGPTGVRVDSSGNVWIADEGNEVIRKVDGTTHKISTYAGKFGNSCIPTDSCGDKGPATDATFTTPRSIALDAAGNLYIADYNANRIREVIASGKDQGKIVNVAGTGHPGHSGDGQRATGANLKHPSSVAVDGKGNVYIADSYNNEIRCVNCLGAGLISDYALNGAYKLGGDSGPALSASMWNPLAVALDSSSGDLFIGGGNFKLVRRVDSDANPPTIGTVAGDVPARGAGGFTGDGGPATQARISNIGMAVDAQQNLYIADAGNNRIRQVQLSPAVSILNPPTNFGSWPINTTSTSQTFTMENSGGGDLSLTGLIFGGNNPKDFSETDTCGTPASLGVDTTCTVTVTFTPLNYGKRSATLLLTDNGPNSPQSVFLNGFGPYFTITPSPATLNIAAGSQSSTTLTVEPFGGFNKPVNLTYAGCPPDSMCALEHQSVTPDGTDSVPVNFTIQTNPDTPVGGYNVTVTGKFGAQGQLQWTATVRVNVTAPPVR